jgi:hypothetical protein
MHNLDDIPLPRREDRAKVKRLGQHTTDICLLITGTSRTLKTIANCGLCSTRSTSRGNSPTKLLALTECLC